MPLILLAIFIVVPLAEIYTFIKVGELIGPWWTIAIVILTALAGTTLLRLQGLAALNRANDAMRSGRLPVSSVIDGVGLLLAGALLLTPGILTDIVGFFLFVPPFRHGLARLIFNRIKASSRVEVHMAGFESHHRRSAHPQNHASGPIIEGEAIEIDPDTADQPPGKDHPKTSPWKK